MWFARTSALVLNTRFIYRSYTEQHCNNTSILIIYKEPKRLEIRSKEYSAFIFSPQDHQVSIRMDSLLYWVTLHETTCNDKQQTYSFRHNRLSVFLVGKFLCYLPKTGRIPGVLDTVILALKKNLKKKKSVHLARVISW